EINPLEIQLGKVSILTFGLTSTGMKNNSVEHQLKERVKELKCLYEISRIAWDTRNDIPVVISKLLKLLPAAMQHSGITEIKITLDKTDYATEKFKKVQHTISSPLVIDKKKRGL